MAPRTDTADMSQGVMEEREQDSVLGLNLAVPEEVDPPTQPLRIVWRNVAVFSILHAASLYAVFLVPSAYPSTWLWGLFTYLMGALGITAGAHRLWAHRSYKAKLPLRVILAIFNSIGFQNDIIEWSRDHRVHHKYSETNADPHNATRGFFYAHIGWLLVRKHPEVIKQGRKLDLSDLYADPVCRIQRKVYLPSVLLLCFVLPTVVPWYFWGEELLRSFMICSVLRYCLNLNFTWLVNSAAHMWGMKPYDHGINPAENFLVVCGAIGEGFHNYHHTFPHDYSTSEYGWWNFNFTTGFIDAMSKLGQAYDLRKVSKTAVEQRKMRTGDGSKGLKMHAH